MAARLGVGSTAISNAITRGKFPPGWFRVLKDMASEAGIDCPMCLFAFVPPSAQGQPSQKTGGSVSLEYPTVEIDRSAGA